MNVKTKNDLGRSSFDVRYTRKTDPGVGTSGSGTIRRTLVAPGQVLYSPYSVPGYKQKIANLQDATSLLIGTKYQQAASSQFRSRTVFGYPGNLTSDQVASGELLAIYGSIPTSAPASAVLAYALAAEDFYSNYKKKASSLQGATALAEAASTIRGLASPAKALRKEVSNLYQSLKGNLWRTGGPAAKDAAQVIGGTWLEWQFGVKPLVSDVDGAAQAFNKMTQGDFRDHIHVKGIGNQEIVTNSNPNQGVGLPGHLAIGIVDSYTIDQTTVTMRGALRITKPGGEVPLAMQFGVGIEDIAPAVWEGIPWSFMWDYFFNISSVIDAWSTGLAGRLSWANRTVRNSRTHMYSDLRPNRDDSFGSTYQRYQASGGHAMASYTSVLRDKLTADQIVPPFRMRLPQFGVKWANLSALAAMKANPFTGGNGITDVWKPVRGVRGGRWYYK